MPDLEAEVIVDLEQRLCRYVEQRPGFGMPVFVNSGGSAAIFRVEGPSGSRAFKVFDPKFLSGNRGEAERKRLSLQERLIGHSCSSLIQTYCVDLAEETAIVEMEFLDWPQLKEVIAEIPDSSIATLFQQLVYAVKFLDDNNVVHRDIKPENIHVAPDFSQLKLLDLGVTREIDLDDSKDATVTDQGQLRPFLATAQYSSPEYLFRLDEPSARLWKGLTFYQLGAVLHDMILKKPLFDYEMKLGNRWLVARAVLTQSPCFEDGDPGRLSDLKALASRCLIKDLDTRLKLVDWDDFNIDSSADPLAALEARMAKGHFLDEGGARSPDSRIAFDRNECMRRLLDKVRADLIPFCGAKLPLSVSTPSLEKSPRADFLFRVNERVDIVCVLHFHWQDQIYQNTADIYLGAFIRCAGCVEADANVPSSVIGVVTMLENENEAVTNTTRAIAEKVLLALDTIDVTDEFEKLHLYELQGR